MKPPEVTDLHSILKGLPLRKSFKGDENAAIAQCAGQLANELTLAWLNEQPKTTPGGARKANTEIQALAKAGYILAKQITEAHSEAYHAVAHEFGGVHRLSRFTRELFQLTRAVYSARDNLEQKPPKAAKRGRQVKRAAMGATSAAAVTYKSITGKRWTIVTKEETKASGPFLDYLAKVFAACELDASPEAQTRKLIARESASRDGEKGEKNRQ